MIRNLISSPIKSLVKSYIRDPYVVYRYITTFDKIAETSIELDTAGEVINDFELEVLFVPDTFGVNHDVVGGEDFSLRVRADGFMMLILPRQDMSTGPRFFVQDVKPIENKINKMVTVRNADTFTSALNNSLAGSEEFTDIDEDIDISVLGTAIMAGNAFLDGKILGFKLWTGGDRNTGTLLREVPINGIASATTEDALGNTITPSNLITTDSAVYAQTENGWIDGADNELEYAYE